MEYVGIYTQQASNNRKSALLLILFPSILLFLVYVFLVAMGVMSQDGYSESSGLDLSWANDQFIKALPWVVGGVSVWFVIAYYCNASMIRMSTGAHEVTRKENPRLYNIVENLTMTCGMPMPKINIMHTNELNAFASGIDTKSYTVTVTTGLMNMLNDDELAGVIGHELTHIRNKDTRLLIISIIFVGIMSTVMSIILRMLWSNLLFGGSSSRRDKKDNNGAAIIAMIVAAVLAALGYMFTMMTRFAISRKREYMADAGGAELCGDPLALASALRKISGMPAAAPNGREDIAQLYIVHPQALTGGVTQWFSNMFSTHPSTESRIKYLEQF